MNSGIAWVRPQKTKFFNEIVEPKQINIMTQTQATTNSSTTLISPLVFTSIFESKSSTVLLRSLIGLAEVMAILLSIAFLPSMITADTVAVKTIVQPKIEIANNSRTCGDRNRGNGTFDCPV